MPAAPARREKKKAKRRAGGPRDEADSVQLKRVAAAEEAERDAVVAGLESAVGVEQLEAALADAKARGFSNRLEAFKEAKRRLFALTNGFAPEALPAKSAAWLKRQQRSEGAGGRFKASGVGGAQPAPQGSSRARRHREDAAGAADEGAPARRAKRRKAERKAADDSAEGVDLQARVAGIPASASEESLRAHFSSCGKILEMKHLKNSRPSAPARAFVSFETEAGLRAALALDGIDFEGAVLRVSKASSTGTGETGGPQKADGKKAKESGGGGASCAELEVFVGGLYGIGRKAIRRRVEECGEVEALELPLTAKGESKGIAFVTFKTQAGLNNLLELDGTMWGKRRLTVERRLSKESRKGAEASSSGLKAAAQHVHPAASAKGARKVFDDESDPE